MNRAGYTLQFVAVRAAAGQSLSQTGCSSLRPLYQSVRTISCCFVLLKPVDALSWKGEGEGGGEGVGSYHTGVGKVHLPHKDSSCQPVITVCKINTCWLAFKTRVECYQTCTRY